MITWFISCLFQESQPRGDYKEFLELAYIFLGGIPAKGIIFKTPGAVHHARWLAKSIYCLKMFLFKKQLMFKARAIEGLRHVCIFILRFYVKAWFDAPNAIKAPNQDLTLLQDLIRFKKHNPNISNAAVKKLCGQSWYLAEVTGLAFFDDSVPDATKLKMVRAIKEREGTKVTPRRLQIEHSEYESLVQRDISDFITKKSLLLFHQFDLKPDFLDKSLELWSQDESYRRCLEVFRDLKVVNDIAERGVALVEKFNSLLTKDEHQRQYLLQVVKHHHSQYPNCEKGRLRK